jgi:hypothetical protein
VNAQGLTMGPDGNLWFTDFLSDQGFSCCGRVGRVTPSGTITEFSIPLPSGADTFTSNRLREISTGPDGNLWFTEGGYRLSDFGAATLPTPFPSSLGRITPTGVLTEIRVPTSPQPAGITAGPDRNVWFAFDGGVGRLAVPESPFLSLQLGDFFVSVSWKSPDGTSGEGQAVPLTTNSGAFWFFSPDNLELVVKVLDGRAINGKWWVFYGALSNVEYTITVTDTQTGAVRTYFNPQGQLASVADTAAF